MNQDWPEVSNHAVETGRFISTLDLEHRRRVAVVGLRVVEELRLGGTRERIRERSAALCLQLLRRALGGTAARLLGEEAGESDTP